MSVIIQQMCFCASLSCHSFICLFICLLVRSFMYLSFSILFVYNFVSFSLLDFGAESAATRTNLGDLQF